MRSDQMLAPTYRDAYLPKNHPTYTPTVLFQELTAAMETIVEECMTIPRNGYWMQQVIFQATAGRQSYRIPYRAVVSAIEKLEFANSASADMVPINQVQENNAQLYESFGGRNGPPQFYCIRGDQIDMLPTPDSSAYSLRLTYYLKPSQLVQSQSSTVAGPGADGVIRGLITAVNPTARTITVNAVPFDQLLPTPVAITSANQRIDVIHPNGSHELSLVNATQTLAGTVFTVTSNEDMSLIEVGDYVRAAEQTDWACIPSEFHRMLCTMGAVRILTQQGNIAKATAQAQSSGGDYARLQKLIGQPRTRRNNKRVPARLMTRSYSMPYSRWRP